MVFFGAMTVSTYQLPVMTQFRFGGLWARVAVPEHERNILAQALRGDKPAPSAEGCHCAVPRGEGGAELLRHGARMATRSM